MCNIKSFITALVTLSISQFVFSQQIEQLSQKGFSIRAIGPYAIYFPIDENTVHVYNIITKADEVIPGSDNRFNMNKIYPSISSSPLETLAAVTFCKGNDSIWYSQKENGLGWTEAEKIYQDAGGGKDTNRSSVSIGSGNKVMTVFQADYQILSKLKNSNGWGGVQVVYPTAGNEPQKPVVKAYGDKFYACYTCDCGQGTALQRQSVQVSRWETGNWSVIHTFTIEGSPDSLDMVIGSDETVYIVATEWCSKQDEYCRILLLAGANGAWGETTIYEHGLLGDAAGDSGQQYTPIDSISINDQGDLIVAFPFNTVQDNDLRLMFKKAGGSWSTPEIVARRGYSALSYTQNDGNFNLFCLNDGSIQLRKYNFHPTPTPTFTPTPTNTPTVKPTSTPGHGGIGCATFARADDGEAEQPSNYSDFFGSLATGIALVIILILAPRYFRNERRTE